VPSHVLRRCVRAGLRPALPAGQRRQSSLVTERRKNDIEKCDFCCDELVLLGCKTTHQVVRFLFADGNCVCVCVSLR
jgi:hypothetical protein